MSYENLKDIDPTKLSTEKLDPTKLSTAKLDPALLLTNSFDPTAQLNLSSIDNDKSKDSETVFNEKTMFEVQSWITNHGSYLLKELIDNFSMSSKIDINIDLQKVYSFLDDISITYF